MDVLDEESNEGFELNELSRTFILEMSNWAKFLAIVGYIGVGVFAAMLLVVLFIRLTASSGFSAGEITTFVFGFFMVAFYFFPVHYLYKAAEGLKTGINTMDERKLTEGFRNLKSHYKFLGVSTVALISVYGLIYVSD